MDPTKVTMVLGGPGIGDLIRESLVEQGYFAEFAPPSIQKSASIGWDGSSPDDLRKTLKEWLREERIKQPGASFWLHPGVSPWAERPELPTVGQELGIHVISPPSKILSLFGNRLALLGEAEKLSIPNLTLSPNPFHSVREIEHLMKSKKLKLPFVLKAVRGGSGYGIRVIHSSEDLGRSLSLWLEQIQRSLGEVILLAERYLEGARRIVQPFARFSDGKIELFPAIDASLLCRFRKLIEFCPASETSDPKPLKQIRNWTEALANQTNFVGVGSLEFLLDGPQVFLIEGISRLNTSFYLWERVAGTSAVAWQLATLQGEPIPKNSSSNPPWKSAISLRFYAEDPVLQLPQPGKILELSEEKEWKFPNASARLTLSVKEGMELSGAVDRTRESPLESRFGGLLGHLWVGADDRKRAVVVTKGILDQIWIAGSLQTNERFLQELIAHPWIQEGMFHAGFIDEEFLPALRPPPEFLPLFLGVVQLVSEPQPTSSPTVKWVVGDQWVKMPTSNLHMEWKTGPNFWLVDQRKGLSGVLMRPSGAVRVLCFPLFPDKWLVRMGAWTFSVRRIFPKVPSPDGSKPSPKLNALVSGKIHSILYREGSWVPAHEPVLVIESLGSLIPHALPIEVKISRWTVRSQAIVHAGQVLAELETAIKN